MFGYHLGSGRTQPPPVPYTGHALSPLKVVVHRQHGNVKGKMRYQKLISNFAGAWRSLLHFCWEQNIPTNAVCREFVREDRNERRGRVSLNVEEMAECKEICDRTDQTNSVWVEITRTRDDKNCPSRILLRIFYSLLPLFKFECKLRGMQNYRKVITAILCLRKTLTSWT